MKIILMHNTTDSQMMGLIFVTKNNKIIAVDGGTRGDAEEFKRLVKEANGGEIDLWLLTHPHHDHHDTLIELSENKDTSIKVGSVCYSPTPVNFETTDDASMLKDIEDINKVMANPFYNTIVVNKGDKFQVDNVTVDVLRVVNPEMIPAAINDLSVVYRLTEKKDDGSEFSFIVLGDLYIYGGRELLEFYKDAPEMLKADAVQMAHHGQSGVELPVYEAIKAKYTFWPTPDWLWTNTPGGWEPGTGPWQIFEVRKWIEDMNAEFITCMEEHAVFDTEKI